MTNLKEYIHAPQNIKAEDVAAIDSLLLKFPYYQTAQLLLTKGLLNTNSIRYNRQLKKTAAYSLDRKRLFSLIIQNKIAISMIYHHSWKQKTPPKAGHNGMNS